MSDPITVLIVDDETQIRLLLRRALEREGHIVIEAADARQALAALARQPAVVLLDLGLPDRDGLELVEAIRRSGAALVVVSAREGVADKVAALDLGADDYVIKPFDTLEVAARVRAAMRHHGHEGANEPVVRCGDLAIDFAARRVSMRGVEVHLAPREYAVLSELARHPGKVLTHAQLLRTVWGPAHLDSIEYLRVTVRAIRRKLGEEADNSIIRNEPAIGYRLVADR